MRKTKRKTREYRVEIRDGYLNTIWDEEVTARNKNEAKRKARKSIFYYAKWEGWPGPATIAKKSKIVKVMTIDG